MTYDWIPVSERYPEINERVLVAVKGIDEPAVGWFQVEEYDDNEGGNFYYWTIEHEMSQWTEQLENVTDWLPMPKMPNKEDSHD